LPNDLVTEEDANNYIIYYIYLYFTGT
jgi:hypothetical protein